MRSKSKTWLRVLASSPLLSGGLGVVHEQLAVVPHGWTRVGGANARSVTTFTIALRQEFEGLEEKLLDVSTPGSPNYGKFLTKEEVEKLFPPPSDAANKVANWLRGNSIVDYTMDGGFIDFSADIETANRLLNASYQYYRNSGVSKLRTLHYSIPDDLGQHIAFVDPGTFFGRARTAPRVPPPAARSRPTRTSRRDSVESPSRPTVAVSCQTSITPPCLKQLYNVGEYEADPKSGSRIGFGSFLNESALYADLALFEKAFDIPSQNFTKVLIANGTNNQDPANGGYDESNLDVQNIIGVAHPLPVTEFITGGSPPFIHTPGQPTDADNYNEPYVPYYRYLLSLENEELPQVISNSYGDDEDGVPLDYAKLTCNLIGLLGLRGITTLFSSGDGGVGGTCLAADFKTAQFTSVFPASCPYLTAVGGTSSAIPYEVAWNGSSGGFSRYFPRPKWQEEAVTGYLAKYVSDDTKAYYGQYVNWTGRAFPDVAAHSLWPNYQIMYAGRFDDSGGTSAAAPVWAAIVGLLNDARLRAGKSTLGWLNPLVYQLGSETLIDITEGYTIGCRTNYSGLGLIPGARWNATPGWDTTTGFGTPDFQKLKEVVLKLFDIVLRTSRVFMSKVQASRQERDISPPPLKRRKVEDDAADRRDDSPLRSHGTSDEGLASGARRASGSTMRLFSWNVNGISTLVPPPLASPAGRITNFFKTSSNGAAPRSRVRREMGAANPLRAFLARHDWPEVLFLQELKISPGVRAKATVASLLACLNGTEDGEEPSREGPDRTYTLDVSLPRDKHNAKGFHGRLYGVGTVLRQDFRERYVTRVRQVDWDLEGRISIVETRSPTASNDGTSKGSDALASSSPRPLALINVYSVNGTSNPYHDPETGAVVGTRHDHKLVFHSLLRDEARALEETGFAVVSGFQSEVLWGGGQ
ncbi:hypothetical protein VTK73DRAFT_9606 [Phialemonium thermophilum]|uniref:tripeptidyl-peptidase II n=1 Tax=Phialemonium thermophilum TaxID=223376 RepID=A0ABR3W1E5_9PEZI